MLNSTSSYFKQKQIDFTVMGLDDITSDFLNWCLKHRDNLETLQESNFMDSKSMMVEVHFDDLKVIRKTKKPEVYQKT